FCCGSHAKLNHNWQTAIVCWAWEPQPCGARRRKARIGGVAAPRRCQHIACVAAPCICLPGARAKMPTYSCANPKPKILCKTPRIFPCVLMGAHASCAQGCKLDTLGTLEAGSVRSQGRNLRVLCVSVSKIPIGGN